MKNLKVGTRLGLGFGIVLLMLAVSIVLSISRMAQLNTDMNSIVLEQYPKVLDAQAILDANNKIARSLRNALLIGDAKLAAREIDVIRGKLKDVETIYGQLDAGIRTPDSRALLNAMLDTRARFYASLDEVIRLQQAGDKDAAVGYMLETMRASQLAYMDAITALIKRQSERMEHARLRAEQSYVSSRDLFLLLGAGALLAGVAAAWIITRALLRQLGGEPDYAASIAASIAAGDLSVPVHTRPGDNHSLLFAISTMRESLTRIVSQVRSGTDSIATASTQIAVGNMDLSTRTEQQASALEETASSMEELTATVKQNASNARQANEMALSASGVAVRGGAVVGQVVQTMGAISASSAKIAEIIGVIDGIAFQTNILALNAAVEAARAGEQGRGFAVVATEVRNLAHRSTAAAREIKTLIENSVAQVGEGSRLVDQAGLTMTDIVASIQNVTAIMGDITLATQEQGAGIEQVNQAVSQMDQVTQQNAALVEEAAAAAESLQEQAAALARVVSVFQLDGAARPTATVHALVRDEVRYEAPAAAPRAPGRPRPKAPVIALRPAAAAKPRLAVAGSADWEEF